MTAPRCRVDRWAAYPALWVALGCAGNAARTAESAPAEPAVACLSGGPETCYDATDDNCNGIIDEGCGTPSGLVHIAISWREAEADVDLDVVGPDGALVEVDQPLDNGLIKVRDCPGENDECRGSNSEHVVLEQEHAVPVGVYHVRVRLEKTNGASPPIRVQVSGRMGPRKYATVLELEKESEEREVVWEL